MIHEILFYTSVSPLQARVESHGNCNFSHVRCAIQFVVAESDFLALGEPGAILYLVSYSKLILNLLRKSLRKNLTALIIASGNVTIHKAPM
jgi:hypothetical protein